MTGCEPRYDLVDLWIHDGLWFDESYYMIDYISHMTHR